MLRSQNVIQAVEIINHQFVITTLVDVKSRMTIYDLDGTFVKEIKLPAYKFSVDTMNQYNRKRKVQTQIDYDPITCVMHDDNSDLARELWYNYYSYYYKDASQKYLDAAVTNGTKLPAENEKARRPGTEELLSDTPAAC